MSAPKTVTEDRPTRLAVGLLSVTLFAADPGAATQTGGTRGISSQGKR